MKTFVKDPDATLDYSVDWKHWLEAGETIVSSDWFVTLRGEPNVDLVTSNPTNSTDAATIWLSGGQRCAEYMVTNRIGTNTTPQRINDQSFLVKIKDQ